VHQPTLKILPELCDGRMHCMQVCPTQAIRIRQGKAFLLAEHCVDCGRCEKVCPHHAIVPHSAAFADLEKFKYLVAVPSAALFGQFPRQYSPEEIQQALTRIGFHEAADIAQACEWVSWAIREYIQDFSGPRPLISSFCPVVVRLIQLQYPSLIDQVIPIKGPELVAVEILKQARSISSRRPSASFDAIYITPCPAMVPRPAETGESASRSIAGAVSIRDLYNPLLAFLSQQPDAYRWPMPTMGKGLRWARPGGSGMALREHPWICVSGLSETMAVLEDIESGKLRDTEYAECWSCRGGCINGTFTVENYYLAYHKIVLLEQRILNLPHLNVDQLRKYFQQGFFTLDQRPRPGLPRGGESTLMEALARRRQKEQALAALPMINCCICGAPNCQCLAEDISRGEAKLTDCVFYSHEKLEELRRIYGLSNGIPPN